LKGVAGPEFARLSTGARITRGNSGNGVLLTRENRAAREQKSRNGKVFAAGANAFPNSPWCLTPPRPLYVAALRFVHNRLRRRLAHFELRALTFWISDACWSRRAVSCAIVAPKSALVAGANAKAGSQIEKPGCVANALSITRFPRWRARSRKAEVVRAPAA
jgi:hypothetical protein